MYEQPYNPFSRNLAIVKDYFKSGSVLALAITRTITIILSIATAILGVGATANISSLSGYLQQLGISSEELEQSMQAFEQYGGTSLLSSLISMIPGVLISILPAAALFIIYFKSRNESPESSPKAGVMILYVLSVISLVCMIIATVIAGLSIVVTVWAVIVFGNQNAGSSDFTFENPTDGQRYNINIDPALITVVAIIGAVFFAIFIVIALVYVVSQKRYYGSIKDSISSVELQNRGAKAYGVFCVIFAVFAGLGLLGIPASFLSLGALHLDTAGIIALIVSDLASVVAFVQLIFEAKVALGYKKYIDEVKYGYNRHASGPYSPYTAPQGQVPYAAPVQPAQEAGPYDPILPEAPAASANPYADSYTAAPKAPTAFVCPSCGSPIDPDITYCGNCGTKLK